MASYSDMLNDQRHAEFLKKWTPDGIENLKPTEDNLRWFMAKARAAEAELTEIKGEIQALNRLLKR